MSCWMPSSPWPGKYPNVVLEIVGPIGNYPIEENFDLRDRQTIRSLAPFYTTTSVVSGAVQACCANRPIGKDISVT